MLSYTRCSRCIQNLNGLSIIFYCSQFEHVRLATYSDYCPVWGSRQLAPSKLFKVVCIRRPHGNIKIHYSGSSSREHAKENMHSWIYSSPQISCRSYGTEILQEVNSSYHHCNGINEHHWECYRYQSFSTIRYH